MPRTKIGPDENVRLRYRAPEDGLVEFEIEADRPVRSYIVRPKGLEVFDEGRIFKYYGGFPDARRKQRQAVRLPFDGPWYLLIINDDDEESANVSYEVYF